MIVESLFIGLPLAGLSSFYLYRKFFCFNFFKQRGIPGPEPHWFYGNVPIYGASRQEFNSKVMIDEWTKKYGNFFGIYEGSTPILVVNDPNIVEQICIKDFWSFQGHIVGPIQPDPLYDLDKKDSLFAVDLLFSWGQHWKRLRSRISPGFSTTKMRGYSPLILGTLDELCEYLRERTEKHETFDIYEPFKCFALSATARLAFGVDLENMQGDKLEEVPSSSRRLYSSVENFLETTSTKPYIVLLAGALPVLVKPIKWLMDALKDRTNIFRDWTDITVICQSVISGRLAGSSRNDILQALIEDSEMSNRHNGADQLAPLTKQEVIMSSSVLLAAGMETTAAQMAFIAYLLAKHPDVQSKLYDEISRVNLSDDSDLYDIVTNKVPYLDWVVKESQRVLPVAYYFTRFCLEDTVLQGIPFPAHFGYIYLNVFTPMRDPEMWGPVAAEQFYPERFSPDYPTANQRRPCTFMPFGYGPRMCVGKRLAEYEMRLAIFMLIRKFRLEEPDGGFPWDSLPLAVGMVMRPMEGVPIRVAARSQAF